MADITLQFGQDIGFGPERGTDVAVPVGTPVVSPFSGSFSSESMGQADWGNRAFVDLGNGLTYAVGHLTQFAKSPGDYVNAGEVIGYSGGAVGDPNSGVTTGPHVEFQFLQGGQFQNPEDVLAQMGLSFDQLFAPGTTAPQPAMPDQSGQPVAFAGASLGPLSDFLQGFVQAQPVALGVENIGQTVQGQPINILPGVQVPNITNVVPGLEPIGNFVTVLQRDIPKAAFIAAGGFLILLGVFIMLQSSNTVRLVETQGAKTAATAAA